MKKKIFLVFTILSVIPMLYAMQSITGQPVKKTRSATFVYEKEKVWESAGDGVTRQIMGYDGQAMLVKVKFEKGAIGTPHTHYHTQLTYVVSGKFEFTVGDEKQIVAGGDGIYIEPDVMHGCVCLEAVYLLIALLRCALIFWLNLKIGSKTVRFVAYIVSEYNLCTCRIFGR